MLLLCRLLGIGFCRCRFLGWRCRCWICSSSCRRGSDLAAQAARDCLPAAPWRLSRIPAHTTADTKKTPLNDHSSLCACSFKARGLVRISIISEAGDRHLVICGAWPCLVVGARSIGMLRTPEERHRTAGPRFPVSPSGKVRITASYYTLRKAKWKTVTPSEKIFARLRFRLVRTDNPSA